MAYNRFWDSNALNTDDETSSYYRNIYEPVTLNGILFDSSVVVEHVDFQTFISYDRFYEVYAREVGMVASVYKALEIDDNDTTAIRKGTELFYEVVDFGRQ